MLLSRREDKGFPWSMALQSLHEQSTIEVCSIGDQRRAVVTWEGRAFVCDDVDAAEHGFEHIWMR